MAKKHGNPNGYYVIQITVGNQYIPGRKKRFIKNKKQRFMYVACDTHSNHPIRLVNSKSAATRFPERGMAGVVSEHFWEHYWKKYEEYTDIQTREVIFVKSQTRKPKEMEIPEWDRLQI